MAQDIKVTALHIKHALLFYFRYERQRLCATEFEGMDVVVHDGFEVHEIEVKISKYDLWKGEAKKRKHGPASNSCFGTIGYHAKPDRFSVAVPNELLEEAEKWVQATNPKYGILLFQNGVTICVRKSAKRLTSRVPGYPGQDWTKRISMRVCSENVGLLGRLLKTKDGQS